MEIGQQIEWQIDGKKMKGLFMQIVNDKAEVICYQMGDVNCHLKVFIKLELLK